MRSSRAFRRAQEAAGEDEMVCGYWDAKGKPRYFVAPRGADEVELRQRAFEAKNGRPMTEGEQLLDAALNGDFVSAFEQAMSHYLG